MAKLLSNEQDKFLRNNVKNISNIDLADLMNKQFGLSLTSRQINTYKKNHKLCSGIITRFEKGHMPFNKGKKIQNMPRNSGMYKKGNKPHNYLPIGTERINGDGYIDVKVADPNKWVAKHVLIWEAAHGKKPKGAVIVFADQNYNNLNLDNLVLVDRKELLIANRKALIKNDTEITKSGLTLAKVYAELNERKKKKKS